jgi:hypothetical protein
VKKITTSNHFRLLIFDFDGGSDIVIQPSASGKGQEVEGFTKNVLLP